MKVIYFLVNTLFILFLFPMYLFLRPSIRSGASILKLYPKTDPRFKLTPEQAIALEFYLFYRSCMLDPFNIHEVQSISKKYIM